MKATSFEELKIWQSARELSKEIYTVTRLVTIANTRSTNWALKRNTRNRQRGRRGNHRQNIRLILFIIRKHLSNNLNFVFKCFWEKRTYRSVNKACNQCFINTCFAFASVA